MYFPLSQAQWVICKELQRATKSDNVFEIEKIHSGISALLKFHGAN